MAASPVTKYAKSGDVHVAYQVVGEGPIDLVMVSGTPSHVELQWESPPLAYLFERLSTFARVITFGKRGTGLSDRPGGQPTLEERMDDVRAVMDAAGSERAVIFGQSEGSPMSILFAATHPERTARLVLYGSIVRWVGEDFQGAVAPQDFYPRLDEVVEHWGDGRLADWFAPSITSGPFGPVVREALGAFERASMSPGAFRDLMRLNAQIDVRAAVSAVKVESLVLHRVGDPFIGIEQSRWLASQLPNARLVELVGDDHLLAAGEVDTLIDEIEEFTTGIRHAPSHDRALATVLFTDIVGSTDTAAEVGDPRWREILAGHDRIVRDHLTRFGEREVKTTGDGFLATFDGPGRACQCALSLVRAVAGVGLTIRAGLHTGEIELRGDDIAGIAVHITARIMAAAGPGEAYASRTVKDLVVGSSLAFEDRGAHTLKGVPGDDWSLYALR